MMGSSQTPSGCSRCDDQHRSRGGNGARSSLLHDNSRFPRLARLDESFLVLLIINPKMLWAESVYVSCRTSDLKQEFLDRIGPNRYADSAHSILGFTHWDTLGQQHAPPYASSDSERGRTRLRSAS
jgi:hypothetical protein